MIELEKTYISSSMETQIAEMIGEIRMKVKYKTLLMIAFVSILVCGIEISAKEKKSWCISI